MPSLGFPAITDEEVIAATTGHSSDDMPDRDIMADLAAADRFLAGDQNMLTVVNALQKPGFAKTAANVLEMGRQRVAGDYLQPSAIFDRNFHVQSASTMSMTTLAPAPAIVYRLNDGTKCRRIRQAKSPRDFVVPQIGTPSEKLVEIGPAKPGHPPKKSSLQLAPPLIGNDTHHWWLGA